MCIAAASNVVKGVLGGVGTLAGGILGGPDIPDPPAPPTPPQGARAPNTTPLKRRNSGAGGIAVPAGSTLLSGPSGVGSAQLSLGSQTLLGGG